MMMGCAFLPHRQDISSRQVVTGNYKLAVGVPADTCQSGDLTRALVGGVWADSDSPWRNTEYLLYYIPSLNSY